MILYDNLYNEPGVVDLSYCIKNVLEGPWTCHVTLPSGESNALLLYYLTSTQKFFRHNMARFRKINMKNSHSIRILHVLFWYILLIIISRDNLQIFVGMRYNEKPVTSLIHLVLIDALLISSIHTCLPCSRFLKYSTLYCNVYKINNIQFILILFLVLIYSFTIIFCTSCFLINWIPFLFSVN